MLWSFSAAMRAPGSSSSSLSLCHSSRISNSRHRLTRLAALWLGLALAVGANGAAAQTKTATSTTLTMTAGGGAVTTVAAGTVVTLTASVKAGTTALTTGQVDFCDATAKYCTDVHVLGMAQLTSTGAATLKFRPGIGSHSYKAVFLGTNTYAGSASGAPALTVTGKYPTTTTITQGGTTGNYTLTATVSSSATAAPGPTGQVSLIDTTSGNAVLTTGTLGTATVGGTLVNASNPPAGNEPTGIVAGDFNGDGNLDLAVGLNDPTQPLSVLLGDGTGNFTAAPASSITVTGTPVLVQDFNGDGIPDILLSDETGGLITVLLGNGDGTFRVAPGSPITTDVGGYPVVAADFNGDGIPDLAVGGNDGVVILLGKGDGTFTQASSLSINLATSTNCLAVGDFNGDGIPDLAAVSGDGVSIYLGNGDGTFTEGMAVTPSGGSPVAVAAADFNGDGKLDLAVIVGSNDTLMVFPGNGDGTFGAALENPIAVEASATLLGVGDFNGDGNADLFVGAQTSGPTINILLGSGNGTFTQMPTGSAGLPCCSNSVLGDFNNDGLTDIASSSFYDGTAQLLVPQFTVATVTASGINPPGPGTQQVEASYPGDGNFAPSVSATTALTPALAAPQISPAPGTYTTEQTIKLTDATPGATIYYNAYGIVNTNGYVAYTGPIALTMGGGETILYYASETGYSGTNTLTAVYDMNLPDAPAPTFSLAAGTYSGSQMLTISDAVAGAAIYYTTNGTIPGVYSTPYTGEIAISSSEVVSAVAIATGYSLSPPGSAQYLISSSSTPLIYTVAGTEGFGFGGDGGPATFALLNNPVGVTEDSQGNLYIADTNNNVIRKVAAGTGVISTVAGTGIGGYSGDGGAATSAELNDPSGIALDSAGDLYIADTANNVVRRIAAGTGDITTVAGNGTAGESGDNGPATSAEMQGPAAVTLDSAGNLYISDSGAGRVRKVAAATGTITTYAGGGTGIAYGSIGDGGPATSAQLEYPEGLALDTKGNLYIADSLDEVVREVNATTGNISTVAGQYDGIGDGAYSGDGGPATTAKLYQPMGVAVDSAGDLYIADYYNNVIREVTASTGDIATYAGDNGFCYGEGGDGGPAADAYLCLPAGVTLDGAGNLYIAEQAAARVRKVTLAMQPPATATATPTFSVQPGSYAGPQTVTLADATPGAEIYLTLDGTTPSTGGAGYRAPIDVDGSVTLKAVAVAPGYLPSAMATGAYTISAPPPAVVSTVAGNGTNLLSTAGQPATQTPLDEPLDVAVDGDGNLYIADETNEVVWQVAAATGEATVVAGTLQSPGYSGDGGPATSAQLSGPNHVALDQDGNLYISDSGNQLVRLVTAATGTISTYAGTRTAGTGIGDGGPATSAHLDNPEGLTFDSAGNLYIADSGNARIRMVNAGTGIITTVAGGGSSPGPSQGDGGPATSASLTAPIDVALDPQGNLYIADDGASRVRKVAVATGIISTVAGNGDRGSSGDGLPATQAEAVPYGLAVDGAGDLYISSGSVVRELAAGGTSLTTFAGSGYTGYSGDGGSATLANFCGPDGLAFDPAGNLYVADQCDYRIRKVTFSNAVATPTFNVAAGAYSSTQSVEISDATQGAIIYYTTDGSTPTPHSSVYSAAIAVNQSETLKAIAVAGGYANSPVAAATYTIGLIAPTVAVTPAASTITTAQSLSVTVAVSGGTGNPTPTGAVTLSSGSYSAQQTLAGGSATFSIAAGALPVGSDMLKATYAPDSASSGTYSTATQSTTVSVTTPIGTAVATVTVTPSVTNLTNAQTLTVAVAVSGASGQPTPTGSATLRAGTWSNQQTLSSGGATFTVPAGTLSAGSNTLTAAYSGDATFAVASGTTTVTVSAVVSSGQTPSPISPGGSATSTITFSAGTTYSGTMNLACALTASPSGAQSLPTCSMNPTSITLASGGSSTSKLTVNTTAASTTAWLHPFGAPLRWLGGGGAALAAVLLFGIPARRRRWASMFALLLAIFAFGTAGCGGGGNSGGGGGGGQTIPATTAGNYTFTVTGTDSVNAQITTATTVVVTVQ
jgi:Chitobiase/beta-hexosaminidase C-terminal domain/FG-GAP-like repeat/Bacterial Ig-like domain (group 3)/NHL repeat